MVLIWLILRDVAMNTMVMVVACWEISLHICDAERKLRMPEFTGSLAVIVQIEKKI